MRNTFVCLVDSNLAAEKHGSARGVSLILVHLARPEAIHFARARYYDASAVYAVSHARAHDRYCKGNAFGDHAIKWLHAHGWQD